MKTKNINSKAANDVLIEELPKADTINNSDLFVLQKLNGETEATSIQELTRKIQDGGTSYGEDLGQILFFTSKTQNPNMHAMDGTIGTKEEYPEFYNFLLTLNELEKQFWALNEVNETFFFKSLNSKFLRITGGSITTEGSSSNYVVDHTHQVQGSYLDNFWINPQTGTKPSGARRVLVERTTGEAIQKTSVALGTGSSTTPISENQAPSVLLYAYVVTKNLNRASSSLYIKSDGTVAMNNDYIPTDPLDVATKKYIDNKFLNYEVPLSFSINDIGKRVPYYKNAETNPTLIALDGTKYLISDYPDFDYETQEGFTNDGVYFWYQNIELEIKSFQNDIQPNSEWFRIPLYSGRPKGETLVGNFEFESKMIYNFLQSPQGAPYLFANPNDNSGFTILDASTYRIRANYNNWGSVLDVQAAPRITKFKLSNATYQVDSSIGTAKLTGLGTGGENVNFYLGATGEVAYLKIQPDYIVAKIQQVGSVAGAGDLKADRSVLLTGTGGFNTKQVTSMDDLKDSNIIVTDTARVVTTLDTKLAELDATIANINVNILNKQQLLINIPILATRINTGLTQNVLLGTPTILGLTGYNVNDYISVTNNIIKLKNNDYKIVNLSGSVLANFVKNDGTPETGGTKYYQVFFRRPSVVTVSGTVANDILNTAFDIKTDSVSIADCEYTFSDSFSSGVNDPFNIDGFVFSVSNSTNTNIQTILTRTGYAKSSFVRIRLG